MDSSGPEHVSVKDTSEHCNGIPGAVSARNISFFLEIITVSESVLHYGISKYTSEAYIQIN
jgi:hypothetical protein